MYHPFSVADTIKTAWYLVRKNFALVSIYSLLGFVTVIASVGLVYVFFSESLWALAIASIVFLLLLSSIVLGFIKLIFQLIDREYYDLHFADIMPKKKMVFSYLFLFLVIYTILFFFSHAIEQMHEGWVKYLLGIFIGGFLQFFLIFYFPICACFIVDDYSGPYESIIQSIKLIKGNFLRYFLLFIIIEAMVFVGFVTLIGMLVAVPFSYIILVVAYRKLIYSHQDVEDDLAETK